MKSPLCDDGDFIWRNIFMNNLIHTRNMMDKSSRHDFHFTWLLWLESNCHRWIPLTKGQWCRADIFSLMFSLLLAKDNRYSCRWFEKPYRLCDVTAMFMFRLYSANYAGYVRVIAKSAMVVQAVSGCLDVAGCWTKFYTVNTQTHTPRMIRWFKNYVNRFCMRWGCMLNVNPENSRTKLIYSVLN